MDKQSLSELHIYFVDHEGVIQIAGRLLPLLHVAALQPHLPPPTRHRFAAGPAPAHPHPALLAQPHQPDTRPRHRLQLRLGRPLRLREEQTRHLQVPLAQPAGRLQTTQGNTHRRQGLLNDHSSAIFMNCSRGRRQGREILWGGLEVKGSLSVEILIIIVWHMHQEVNWNDPIKVGGIVLSCRIVMSALTRERCTAEGVPTPMVAEYYGQRASAGLIFTETTAWCQRGRTSQGSPGLYSEEQAQGWRLVTDAVHQRAGKIFVQLAHAGRATNPEMTFGLETWAPSAISCREKIRYLGGKVAPAPHEMTREEIKQTQAEFESSLKLAKLANFDGVQLQGAHGYIIDQFLKSCSNTRTDEYGGSPQNRARYCLQLFDIALKYFQPWQLAIKLSPVSRAKDMFDQHPEETFGCLLKGMSERAIAFAQIRESTEPYALVNHYGVTSKEQLENVCKTLRPYFNGILIGNDSFNRESGLAKIRSGECDAISFGQFYVSNPDLAERIINNYPIKQGDKATFYGGSNGSKGYTDYPVYQA